MSLPDERSDLDMTDVNGINSSAPADGIEELKQIIAFKFEELGTKFDKTIAGSINTWKAELQNQIKMIQIRSPQSLPIGDATRGDPYSSENVDYKGGYQEKEKQCRELESRIRTLEAQNSKSAQELETRLNTTVQQNKALQENVDRFRGMIFKNASSVQDVPDSKIIDDYNGLIHSIHQIAFRYYSKNVPSKLNHREVSRNQYDFFNSFGKPGLADFELRIRAKIFELLCEGILCRPLFGLDDDHDPHSKSSMEDGLSTFEVALNSFGKDYEADAAEWRWRTMKCAKRLRTSTSTTSDHTANAILRFMEPVEPSSRKPDLRKDLENQLFNLCDAAFNLTLLLRSFKDEYRYEIPKLNSVWSEDEADQQASEGPSSATGTPRIAVVLSGSLVKFSQPGMSDKHVLVKAQVVTRG